MLAHALRAMRPMCGRRAFSLAPIAAGVETPELWEIAFAARLRAAFSKGTLLDAAEFPAELHAAGARAPADVLRAADRIQALTIAEMHMQRIGYKIGATNAKAQASLGLTSSFVGPCFQEATYDSPAAVVATGRHVRGVECEFGFEMRNALLPRGPNGTPYTDFDVAKAVRKMVPCIEVVGSRFASSAPGVPPLPPLALLSDLGGAHAVVKGNHHHKNWADVPLDATHVKLLVNGEERASGRGADVLGHPIRALTWLVNYLSARNIALHKDAFVITGTCTGITPVRAGDKIEAVFGDGFGSVEVKLE